MRILMGFSGQAARSGVAARSSAAASVRIMLRSLSLEDGFALLHERAASLRVILALEAILDEALAEVHVDVRVGLQHLADDSLPRLDGERRPSADGIDVFGEQGVELLARSDAVHEADALRFLCIKAPTRIEDVLRGTGAHEIHQVLQGGEAVAEAKPRRRDREHGIRRCDADIAAD